jgi:hypothetical protein
LPTAPKALILLKTNRISLLIPLFLLAAIALAGFATGDEQQPDETDTQAVRKANFLFNFCKYTSGWAAPRKEGNFNLAIRGNKPLFDELQDKYANKLIGSQPLKVFTARGPEAGNDIHAFYLAKEHREELTKLIKQTAGRQIIIITDFAGGIDNGATFNFTVVENAIRYELNETGALQRGLIPAEKIKSWAIRLK